VREDAPAGDNLEDSDERQQIRAAFDRPVAADDDPGRITDWGMIEALIRSECQQTRDLELGVLLARLGTGTRNLTTVADGLDYLTACVEHFWSSCYPALDDVDYVGRENCLSLLDSPDSAFLRPLGAVTVLSVPRVGEFSLDDIIRLTGPDGRQQSAFGRFRAALDKMDYTARVALLAQLKSLASSALRIEEAVRSQPEGKDFALRKLRGKLAGVISAWASETGGRGPGTGKQDGIVLQDMVPASAFSEAGTTGLGTLSATIAGPIQSREQVLKALDAIAEYYVRMEPASPLLVMVDRIKGWVGMDFMSLIRDIAPNATEDAARVLRTRSEEG